MRRLLNPKGCLRIPFRSLGSRALFRGPVRRRVVGGAVGGAIRRVIRGIVRGVVRRGRVRRDVVDRVSVSITPSVRAPNVRL